MISISAIRQAHRRKTEARIAAFPSSARFPRAAGGTPLVLAVRTSEPRKTRELRLGGFASLIELEAEIALPLTAARPQPEKEAIQIEDIGGEWRTYTIVSATPLEGLNCYLLGLRADRSRPTNSAPPSFAR